MCPVNAGAEQIDTGADITSRAMTIRTRKLIGTVLLLVFLAVYAFLAMLVAVVIQVNGSKLAELLFYVVGGLAWVVPAALLVRWMQKPDAPEAE
jgi:hypothetical protein